MKNKDLKKIYNKVYKGGEKKHYTKNLLGYGVPLQISEALKEINWKGKTVLDVGCGTGLFVSLAKKAGAKEVLGVDYSGEAIKIAKENYSSPGIDFQKKDFNKIKGRFDVIVSLGTLEHMDSPLAALKKFKKLITKKGSIIIVVPNWSNPRGHVLLTLYYLFNAPITLSDKHYLTPLEFKKWAKKINMSLSFRTFDNDWAMGKKMIKDFKLRLPKILPKNKNTTKLTRWFEGHVLVTEKKNDYSGALGLYHFK